MWWRWAVEMGEGGGGQDEGREHCLPSEASQLEQVAGWVRFRGAQHGSARPVKWTRAERQGKHAPSEDPNHRLFEQPRPERVGWRRLRVRARTRAPRPTRHRGVGGEGGEPALRGVFRRPENHASSMRLLFSTPRNSVFFFDAGTRQQRWAGRPGLRSVGCCRPAPNRQRGWACGGIVQSVELTYVCQGSLAVG